MTELRFFEELGAELERAARQPSRTRRWLWSAVGAAGTVVSAGVVTVVILLSSGAPAYAGWAPVPTAASAKAVATAISKCYKDGPNGTPLGQPVLAETRGKSTAAIYVIDGTVSMCLYDSAHSAVSTDGMGPFGVAPGPDKLSLPYGVTGGSSGSGRLPRWLFQALRRRPDTRATLLAFREYQDGDGYGYWVLGRAGSDVSAVTFAFARHETVTATVQNGWYFAWWPWTSDPTSAAITTSTGTATSPMKNSPHDGFGPRPYPACEPGSNDCIFVKTRPVSSTTKTTTRSPSNAGAVATATSTCNASVLNSQTAPAQVFSGQPVLTEVHGVYTALFNISHGRLYGCLTGGNQKDIHAFFDLAVASFGEVRKAPGPDQLGVPYTKQDGFGEGRGNPHPIRSRQEMLAQAEARRERLTGGGYGPYAIGQAGSDVTGITFAFANRRTATATIQNGWYLAWWPWVSDPVSVTVTTNSGTTTKSPLATSASPGEPISPGCTPGSSGCIFKKTPPAATTSTAAPPTRT
jgi:hypothetical protein